MSEDGIERLLDDGERRKELARREYRDTELEVVLKGPEVTDHEYRERVEVVELAVDPNPTLRGWKKVSLPPDTEAIDQFISVLMEASNRLSELEGNSESGFYEEETPWGTVIRFECVECGWADQFERVQERGECENCGRSIATGLDRPGGGD